MTAVWKCFVCMNILIFKVLSIEDINTKVNNQRGSDKKGQL